METIQSIEKFQEVIQSEQPVIINFDEDRNADGERLDMSIGAILDEFNQFAWYEVNSDELTFLLEQYHVNGSSGILIFQNGEKLAYQHNTYTKTPEEVAGFLHQQLG